MTKSRRWYVHFCSSCSLLVALCIFHTPSVQRAEMGGANAALESHRQIKKQTSILENRLDKALQKYNETLAQNKALRREIDSLRQERLSFERQYGRLDKELQGIKQQMADVIEAANEAYEIRDNAEFHTAEIREEMGREKAEFKALLGEVDARIGEEAQRVRRMDDMTKGALTASEEAQLQDELIAGQRRVELTRAKVARAGDKIAFYEEAFSKIKVRASAARAPLPAPPLHYVLVCRLPRASQTSSNLWRRSCGTKKKTSPPSTSLQSRMQKLSAWKKPLTPTARMPCVQQGSVAAWWLLTGAACSLCWIANGSWRRQQACTSRNSQRARTWWMPCAPASSAPSVQWSVTVPPLQPWWLMVL